MTRNADLMAAWLDWLAAGNLSPNTIRNRRYTLASFAKAVDLTTASTGDILDHLRNLPGGAWSKSGHLAAIKSFYFWMVGTGQRGDNPALMVKSIKTHDRTHPRLPKGTLDRAILLAPNDQVRLALLLGAYAGLRRAEIAAFHTSNIRGDHMVIVGKGDKERRIYIHPRLRPLLDDLTPGWAFPSHVWPGRHVTPETIQRMVTKALGEPWTTHDLRRYAATAWYDASKDLRAVQELLGHADPMTTSRYVAANDDAMQRAVLAVA